MWSVSSLFQCVASVFTYSPLPNKLASISCKNNKQDGRISYDEFVAMMKTGTDWRKASRQYSRERFKSLSLNLIKDGSLQLHDGVTGQVVVV